MTKAMMTTIATVGPIVVTVVDAPVVVAALPVVAVSGAILLVGYGLYKALSR